MEPPEGWKDSAEEWFATELMMLGLFTKRMLRALEEPTYRRAHDRAAVERKTFLQTFGFYPDHSSDVEMAILTTIHHDLRPTEYDLQGWVRENIATLVPGSACVPIREKAGQGRCDLLLSLGGEDVPVEVKLLGFGNTAVRQLRRYMNFYGAKRGLAIATRLDAELPSDMTFVCIRGWEERRAQSREA